MPNGIPLDVHFHLESGARRCHVARAWNAALSDEMGRGLRCAWEFWSSDDPKAPQPAPRSLPKTLAAAIENGSDLKSQRKAAAEALAESRTALLENLRHLNSRQSKAHTGVNSTQTVAAGLAIAAAATIELPPVSLGLGIGSAAVGLLGTASEMTVDSITDPEMRRYLNEYKWEASTFQALEERILRACLDDLEPCLNDYPHLQWLFDMCTSARSCVEVARNQDVGTSMKQLRKPSKAAAGPGRQALTQALREAAKVANEAKEVVDEAAKLAIKASHAEMAVAGDAAAAARAAQALKTAGNVLVVTGAVMSVGICIWGWCSHKENVQTVKKLVKSLETSEAALKDIIDDDSVTPRPSFCSEVQKAPVEKE